jgi:hypothetical protein
MISKTFKKGEAMQKDGDDCFTCRKTNCIQVSANGNGYCGTVSYAVEDSK